MPSKTLFFNTHLADILDGESRIIPLCQQDIKRLSEVLTEEDDYVYLSISDGWSYEVVKARVQAGVVLAERAVEGTRADRHGFGACVKSVSPLVIAQIKDLICNYNCCEEQECPCQPIAVYYQPLPEATEKLPWRGEVVFTGDTPMTLIANNTPAWMQVERMGSTLILSGTPPEAGSYEFSVGGTNCNGTNVVTQNITLAVNPAEE